MSVTGDEPISTDSVLYNTAVEDVLSDPKAQWLLKALESRYSEDSGVLASEHGHTTIKSSTTLIITQSDFTSDIAAGVVLRHPTKYNIIVMRDSRDWETRAKGQSGNTTSAPIMIDVKDKNDVSMSRSLPEVIVATLDTIPMDMTLHTMEKCIFFEPETSDTIREI
ncbi:hypothetical protein HBI43_243430, partial [Parastagonospora nodorum]